MRRFAIQFGSEPTANASAFNGGAQVDTERSLDDFRLERNYFQGVSCQALYKQNAGQEARCLFHVGNRAPGQAPRNSLPGYPLTSLPSTNFAQTHLYRKAR